MKQFGLQIIALILISLSLCGQEVIDKKYCKNKYGVPASNEKSAKFIEITKKETDGIITTEFQSIKDNKIVWVRHFKDELPIGKWIDYNSMGEIQRKLDYDFDLVYNDSVYKDILHFDLYSKRLKESIEGKFESPNFLYDDSDFYSYLAQHLTYPDVAKENDLQGKVLVQCILDDNGKITDASVFKSAHKILDKEALRVVKELPNWEPAKLDGKPIKVCITVLLAFVIQ
jgi:TonB family protein